MPKTDELLTVQEAADVLGVTVRRMYNRRCSGLPPTSWVEGGRLVYPRSGLDSYLVRAREDSTKGQER